MHPTDMIMADTTNAAGLKSDRWRPDPIWLTILIIPVGIWLLDPNQVQPIISEALSSFGHTSIFIAFAVFLPSLGVCVFMLFVRLLVLTYCESLNGVQQT